MRAQSDIMETRNKFYPVSVIIAGNTTLKHIIIPNNFVSNNAAFVTTPSDIAFGKFISVVKFDQDGIATVKIAKLDKHIKASK